MDKPRYSWKKTICAYTGFIALWTVISTLWVLAEAQSYARFITISFSIGMIIFFCFMSKCSISQILYNVSLLVFVLLWGVGMGVRTAMLFFNGNVWADILFRCFYFVIVVWLYYRYLRKTYLEIEEYLKSRWKWLAAVGLAGDALFIYCSIFPQHVMVRGLRDRLISSGVGIILFATHIIMLWAIYAMRGEMKVKEEMEYSLLNNAYLERSLAMIEEKVEQADRTRHDVRHHDLVIMEYARKGEVEELLRYMEEKEEAQETQIPARFCENKTVNSILTAYAQRAQQAGIRMTVQSAVRQDIGVRDIDFTAILGNALENAVHGCVEAGSAGTLIDVRIQMKNDKLTMMVKNTCQNQVDFENGVPQSRKGGIGIRSMLRSAREYNGQLDFQCEDNTFKVRIVLKVS